VGQLDGAHAFHQLEVSYQMLFHQMLDGFVLFETVFDVDGKPVDFRYLAVNPAYETLTGLSAETVLGKRLLEVLPNTEFHWIETYGRVVLTGEPHRFERFHAGLGMYLDVVAFRPREGRCAVIFQDVTKRKEHEEQIERLNRLYAVLSQVNQAIVRAGSPDELFQSICQVAVTFGQFRLVWIGTCHPETGAVTLRAKATDDRGFPYAIQAGACGVVESAIREARPRICNVLTGNESGAECHVHAMREDIGSCAALPILSQGRVCAALCLHAREALFFNPAEVQLLEDVARDTSFALDKLEEEARRRQAEEETRKAAGALLESQRFVERILDIAPALVYIYDLVEERNVYANRSALDFLGYAPERIQSMGAALFQTILHPGDAEMVAAHHARFSAADDNQALEVEYRMMHADGQWRWLRSREVLFLRDEQGVARRILGWAEDVTERKRNEAALRASEERYRLISENTADVIWLMDAASGQLNYISPSVKRLLGYSAEEVPAKGLADVLTPDSYRYATGRLADSMAAFEAGDASLRTQTHQVDQVRKDGSIVRVEVVTTLLPDERGRVREILGVTRDITERMQAEARLAQAQKMESVGRLAGGVAHDFNNLLTVINGYSQMLLGDLHMADPLREGVEEIRKAGERAAGLTAQLLAFSRKQVLQPRALDLNQVAGAMEPMLARLVGEDVEVRVALSAAECVVRADPHQLEQAIMNLAVNARDAMPRGGKLLIETAPVEWDEHQGRLHPGARPGRYVMLAVSDTGEGMDEATRLRVFEPFFTTKGAGKGTGLGLSTVQGIVAQSGGHIEVYSEPGFGTTFKMYLPRVAESAVSERRPEAPPALGGTETVLVVEDQAEVRDYTAAALESYGYRVLKAASAAEALSICEREGEHIDLVLTDVVMPNVGGFELAGRVEKLRPGMRVLYMSGYTDNAIVEHGILGEGAEFITKPFGPERLAARVRAVLGPRQP
jgi:PAS domain S-box-containing protein